MNLFVNLIKRTAKQFLNNNNYYSIKDYEKKYRFFLMNFFLTSVNIIYNFSLKIYFKK